MNLFEIPRRRLALVVAAAGVVFAVAACGSSSTTSTTTPASSSNSSSTASRTGFSRSTFVACLKQHGVTLPSRRAGGAPAGGAPPPGGGFFGGGGGGGRGFRNNPKFAAAFKACGGANRFGFGRGGRGRFRISHTAINNYVACVRQHGYPQMPSPNFSGKGPVFPASIRTNSKFQSASRACQSILVPARPGGVSGTSTNPSS